MSILGGLAYKEQVVQREATPQNPVERFVLAQSKAEGRGKRVRQINGKGKREWQPL